MPNIEPICATCQHLKSGPMTKAGFNRCAIKPISENYPLRHSCSSHTIAPQSALDKRAAWLASVAAARQPALVARG